MGELVTQRPRQLLQEKGHRCRCASVSPGMGGVTLGWERGVPPRPLPTQRDCHRPGGDCHHRQEGSGRDPGPGAGGTGDTGQTLRWSSSPGPRLHPTASLGLDASPRLHPKPVPGLGDSPRPLVPTPSPILLHPRPPVPAPCPIPLHPQPPVPVLRPIPHRPRGGAPRSTPPPPRPDPGAIIGFALISLRSRARPGASPGPCPWPPPLFVFPGSYSCRSRCSRPDRPPRGPAPPPTPPLPPPRGGISPEKKQIGEGGWGVRDGDSGAGGG